MKRFLRRLSAPKSDQLTSADKARTITLSKATLLTEKRLESGENCVRFTKLSHLLGFDGSNTDWEAEAYSDLFITESGHFLVRSGFTDSTGKRLGPDRVLVFVISPSGRVVMGENNGVLVHPKMADLIVEAKQEKNMEEQINTTRKALDMAFRKNKRSDARWQHQAHVLATLEAELAQTMKSIRRTKLHTAVLKDATRKTQANLSALRQHETTKLEHLACQKDPENFKRYNEASSREELVELLKDITRRLNVLETIRDLTQRKYATQRRQEKAQEKARSRPHLERPKVRGAATTIKTSATVGRRSLVQQLLRISDDRRRREPTLETEL